VPCEAEKEFAFPRFDILMVYTLKAYNKQWRAVCRYGIGKRFGLWLRGDDGAVGSQRSMDSGPRLPRL